MAAPFVDALLSARRPVIMELKPRSADGEDLFRGRSPAEIRDWLLTEVAARVGIEPRRIDSAERFSRYGLDSMKAAGVTAALAAYLGRTLPRTLLWDHPSIDGVVRHLTAARAQRREVQRQHVQDREYRHRNLQA